jgi:glycosyltransferase involved in cell wall biosynthesis
MENFPLIISAFSINQRRCVQNRNYRSTILKIAMVAPVEIRIPPVDYGGIEIVVSILTEELVRRGHEVTLYASGDSITSAKLISVVPEYLRKSQTNPESSTAANLVTCLEHANEYDIIHNHTVGIGLLSAGLVRTPVLTTLHGPMDTSQAPWFQNYKGWYNVISKSQVAVVPKKTIAKFAGVVYNSIDCSQYPFNRESRGDYLLYFSRFSPEKGALEAIRAAMELDIPLILAGNISNAEFFQKKIRPFIDGRKIRCETKVPPERKRN